MLIFCSIAILGTVLWIAKTYGLRPGIRGQTKLDVEELTSPWLQILHIFILEDGAICSRACKTVRMTVSDDIQIDDSVRICVARMCNDCGCESSPALG